MYPPHRRLFVFSLSFPPLLIKSSDMSFYQTGLKQHHALQHADPLTFGGGGGDGGV